MSQKMLQKTTAFAAEKSKFYRYVIPSIGSSMVTALYFVVDGIFVGRGVGVDALAAVNIALPFVILVISCTMMLTMGGATLTSISFGEGDDEKAKHIFKTTMMMVLIFAVLSIILGVGFTRPIAILSGASDLIMEDTVVYLRFYSMFGIFYCLAMCLAVFVRNDGNPRLALWGMVAGAVINIFFDWYFIFPLQMGLMGAAVASGMGQAVACLILLSHFFMKKGKLRMGFCRIKARLCWQIMKRGTPEFVTQMNQTITILLYNILAMNYLGEIGVSCFAIVCYLMEIIIACFLGVSQGIQPLISYSYGEKNYASEQYYFRAGLRFNVILASVIYVFLFFFGGLIASIFNSDPQLISMTQGILRIYCISFVLAAINIVFTTYYLSTKRTGKSILIAVARSFVLNSAFIFIMPGVFGENMLWTGIIVAELLVATYCLLTRPKTALAAIGDAVQK